MIFASLPAGASGESRHPSTGSASTTLLYQLNLYIDPTLAVVELMSVVSDCGGVKWVWTTERQSDLRFSDYSTLVSIFIKNGVIWLVKELPS